MGSGMADRAGAGSDSPGSVSWLSLCGMQTAVGVPGTEERSGKEKPYDRRRASATKGGSVVFMSGAGALPSGSEADEDKGAELAAPTRRIAALIPAGPRRLPRAGRQWPSMATSRLLVSTIMEKLIPVFSKISSQTPVGFPTGTTVLILGDILAIKSVQAGHLDTADAGRCADPPQWLSTAPCRESLQGSWAGRRH